MLRHCSIAVAVALVLATMATHALASPELPHFYVETAFVPPSERAIAVHAGGDFQAALNAARPGDVITLDAGATFTGPFTLPKKRGGGWITVRTSAVERLPSPGTRVTPSHASAMPRLVAAGGPVIAAAPRAHDYRFVGIEIRPAAGAFLQNLVLLGSTARSTDDLPHHIIFDRCYIHGDPARGSRRGIALNARNAAVIDSYLADFKEVGADSQAIAVWNGAGPIKIVNNYVEGAGENVLLGGADPAIPDLVPSDIEIRNNHFNKPLVWKPGHPGYMGVPWTVKNLLELKNARRVLIEGNLFEHHWVQAQSGFAILFTVRNQDGGAPWSVVEDVTFSNNVVRHTASGINILGRDTTWPSGSRQTRRILISNNLFVDVGGASWGGGGRLFQLLDGTASVVIDHNTAFQTGNIVTAEGMPHAGFVFTNNIAPHNDYGIIGTNTGPGNSTLETYFPGAVVRANTIVGGPAGRYPEGNFFPASLDEVRLEATAEQVYSLAESSPFRRAGVDGKDLGADPGALIPAITTTREARH